MSINHLVSKKRHKCECSGYFSLFYYRQFRAKTDLTGPQSVILHGSKYCHPLPEGETLFGKGARITSAAVSILLCAKRNLEYGKNNYLRLLWWTFCGDLTSLKEFIELRVRSSRNLLLSCLALGKAVTHRNLFLPTRGAGKQRRMQQDNSVSQFYY